MYLLLESPVFPNRYEKHIIIASSIFIISDFATIACILFWLLPKNVLRIQIFFKMTINNLNFEFAIVIHFSYLRAIIFSFQEFFHHR